MFKQQPNMIFLLGAGRSGSTLLYKLLSLHAKVGYISSYNNSFPAFLPTGYTNRWLSQHLALKRSVWFERSGNAHGFQRGLFKRLIPWPVEGENIYARAGIPLFEAESQAKDDKPAQKFRESMLRLAQQQGADSMLSKRVANNRRIPWLQKAFPEAKFIHLIRDGRDVAHSFTQVNWWHDNARVWWANKTMRELKADGWDALSVTAKTWVEAVTTVDAALGQRKDEQVLHVRYEDLLKTPLLVLENILQFMEVEPNSDYIEQVQSIGLKPVKSKWKSAWQPQAYEKVLQQQQTLLKQLDYL